MNKLAKQQFPLAQVPGATSVEEVFSAWKNRGFKPIEITQEAAIQRIEITHDPLKGELNWKSSNNMDGLGVILIATQALCLMPSIIVADAAFSICEYFTRGEGQLDLGTGEAMVIIAFKEGRLALEWQPKDSPVAAKKLLASALIYMLSKDAGLPLDKLFTSLGLNK